MYLLEDGTSLTQEIKEAFKKGLTRAYIKLGNTIIDPDNYLQNAKYKDEKADPNSGQFIGVTSMRELTIKLYNYDNSINLENQEVEYYVGALVGNEYKYIKFGNFIVQEVQNEEVNEETTFTALDYMIKFDGDDAYEPTIDFGNNTTLLDLAQDICRQVGVELGNNNFRNATMPVLANPFINGENCRTVLKSIAKVSFSPAYIGQDNKLYIGFNVEDGITEYITTDDFFENKPNDEVKPITAITLRSSEVKAAGQTHYASQEMIEQYGINELIIEEDYLAYTDTLRNAYLTGAEILFGLTYKPLSIDLLGNIYLSHNDLIQITNLQENEYTTYALNNNHEYNGTLFNTISAPALTENEEKYKYESEDATYRKKTAIEIDKANQEIRAVVYSTTDTTNPNSTSSKVNQLTLKVDELDSRIKEIVDIAVSGETETANISPGQLDDINPSEPITIKIHPIIQNICYLYPSIALFPSNTTYLKTRTLRFTNTSTNENFDYELPCDLYYYDAEHYDEFILDYGDGETKICAVNKKVGINADGTTYLLNEQTTIDFPYPTISLTEGDYIVSLLGYEAGYIFTRLMVKNIYTDQFATKVELSTEITQTSDSITAQVNETLDAYPTKIEMNTAITLKTDSIESTVSTKVGKDEIISRINQTSEQIAIEASKINLNGVVTANNYFKINQNGSMETISGKIANINISDEGLYYSGTDVNDGFGLWKNGLRSYNDSYIIFHAGKNNSQIGNAPFKILQNGSMEVTKGKIANINISTDGLFYSGSSSNDGFGLWKNGVHSDKGSYIIFHSGGNNSNIGGANFRVYQNGSVYAKDFNVIGDSDAFKIYDNDGVIQFQFNKDRLVRYNNEDKSHKWIEEGRGFVGDAAVTHTLWLYDAQRYTIQDEIHRKVLFVVNRYGDEASPSVPFSHFYTHVTIGTSGDNRNLFVYGNIYNNGYVITPNSSDRRLKDNIVKSDINATDLINKINHVSFDWNKEKSHKEGHINIGYIAQELMKVDSNFVIYNKEFDTYQIDVLYVLSTATKAIQELQQEINELKERMK